MEQCSREMRGEFEAWKHQFAKAVTYLESIVDHTDEADARLTKLIEQYEELERKVDLHKFAFQDLLSSDNLRKMDIETHFKKRVKELGPSLPCNQKLILLKQKLKRQTGADSDLVVDSVRYSKKDHISKKDIVVPIRNTICKHVYDKETVTKYINDCRKRRALCQCPVPSCSNKRKLDLKEMEPYPDFFNFVMD